MTEIRFYHLTRKTLEQVLPEMLEMTLQRGHKAVVMCGSPERAEALTQHLWTYNPNNFLPHGNAKDGNADMQPVWLTAEDERPNEAGFLFLTDGAETGKAAAFERVCDIFDGNDETALAAARRRWAAAKAGGHTLSYWQQNDKGWADATPQG
ncbi:MAG: DNA polymerase III subunit chi [Alphaproteobacteria bacterium]|nr:DNA polymerase III subunit chi [Alphaproteobacteria bacterium]